ncbi:MAG: beta-propeller domain-containing protein [Clostridia bacterium]|nr:beta-propeller domain-containing protein [Clostridia bacterium]
MKKNDIYEEISNISPDLIAEADPTTPIVTRKTKIRRAISAVAACFVLLIASSCLWLFVPYSRELPKELGIEKGDKAYDLYSKIYEYSCRRADLPKNNYEKYTAIIIEYLDKKRNESDELEERPNYAADPNNSPSEIWDNTLTVNNDKYIEVTDNQVSGIIESDLFKRTNTHIFYLEKKSSKSVIRAYRIDGEESILCGTYEKFVNVSNNVIGMFLSQDGETLTVIESGLGIDNFGRTALHSIDVSDPSKMYEKRSIEIKGDYSGARSVNGKLLLMYSHGIHIPNPNVFEIDPNYLPRNISCFYKGKFEKTVSFDYSEIIVPNKVNQSLYTVFLWIDEDTLDIEDKMAVLACFGKTAVFDDKIVFANNYSETKNKISGFKQIRVSKDYSDIFIMSYGTSGFDFVGQITLDGRIKNQYSMDIKDGIFRAVTSTETETMMYEKIPDSDVYDGYFSYIYDNVNVSLWCYDLNECNMIASVRSFAPEGDKAKSVRFDGDMLYVCTAKTVKRGSGFVNIDPVYFFDLSDYENITYTDTGEIEGYSTSLSDFKDETLLGIGYGVDKSTMKVEIYKENGNKVESVCAYEVENVNFLSSYKSYYIDSVNGYIGLTYWINRSSSSEISKTNYVLLHFDGEKLIESEKFVAEGLFSIGNTRMTMIDGFWYVFCENQFFVKKID